MATTTTIASSNENDRVNMAFMLVSKLTEHFSMEEKTQFEHKLNVILFPHLHQVKVDDLSENEQHLLDSYGLTNRILTEYAAKNGYITLLKYAHENGCPWNANICAVAAMNGHINCLCYAHENGCPWDESTAHLAASYGQLKCLQYAHEHGCSWNDWTVESAANNGQLECFLYAIENGCPCGEKYRTFLAFANDKLTTLTLSPEEMRHFIKYKLQTLSSLSSC